MGRSWIKWTDDEDAWLKKHYNDASAKEVAAQMNKVFGKGRTANAVQRRAITIGVSKKSPFTEAMQRWMVATFKQYDSGSEQYQAYREKFGDEAASVTTLLNMRRQHEVEVSWGDKRRRAWIIENLSNFISDKSMRAAFEDEFAVMISESAFHKMIKLAEKAVSDGKADAMIAASNPMRHIRMHAADYRRVCCVCGRRTYQAETVIGKAGKRKTYCTDCYNKLIELPRIRRKKTKKRKEGPKNKPSDIVVKR